MSNFKKPVKDDATVVDVDIDQDFKFKLDQETKLDVETTNDTTSTYKVEVDAPKFAYTKVDIDIDEEKNIKEKHTIDFTETVTKTVDINLNENVTKTVDVSVWDINVDVHASSIIESATVVYDTDVNDIDMASLIEVGRDAEVKMDDFDLEVTSIGGSFNGAGNDGFANVNQSNNLVDNDHVGNITTGYYNKQAPNIDGSLKAKVEAEKTLEGTHTSGHAYGSEYDSKTFYDWKGQPYVTYGDASHYGLGGSHSWLSGSAAASGSLAVDLSLSAPTEAFQTVTADGGEATAADGIDSAHLNNTNSNNEGDGIVDGSAVASADASAVAAAFNNEIMAGGNQQANFATIKLTGGDLLDGGDVKGGKYDGPGHKMTGGHHPDETPADGDGLAIRHSEVTYDDDLNDIDLDSLIDVKGELTMDDFNLDITSIADSFNGPGNDWAFDVNQANDLVDNDSVYGVHTGYVGEGWNGPFQSVSADGGMAMSGNGIGNINGHGVANGNGGDGIISGSTAASADALASATAFTNSIVVGANLQVNNFSATVVGGDETLVNDLL